jgi:hypothetical protein
VLDSNVIKREDIYMNKNMKRAQSPKVNRHLSSKGKRMRQGVILRGPRARDDRAANNMMVRSGMWEA